MKAKTVKQKSITSQVKTFEGACKLRKLNPKKLPDVSMLPEAHRKSIIAFYMLTVITEALNEGWTPNWNDSNEWKYYNYFWIKADSKRPTGFGFSFANYATTYSSTFVGSRLCFKNRGLADYARGQFKKLYQDYLLM